MKIKISSPNTKSETQNLMQYVLQKYTSYTCHENAQSGPHVVWFHHSISKWIGIKLVLIVGGWFWKLTTIGIGAPILDR